MVLFFRSARSKKTGLFFLLISLLPLLLLFDEELPLLVALTISCFLLMFFGWFWFRTYYKIGDEKLYFRNGPFFGQLKINTIRKIEKDKYLWAGLRPALSFKGLVIYYNAYDQVYLSPSGREEFIQALLQKNSGIEVVEHRKA